MNLLEQENAFTYTGNIFVFRPMQPQNLSFTGFVFYGGGGPGRQSRPHPGLPTALVPRCPGPH